MTIGPVFLLHLALSSFAALTGGETGPAGIDEATTWRTFNAAGWTVELAEPDLLSAAHHRRRAVETARDEPPPPWYVTIRIRRNAADSTVERRGFICGRGHVDDDSGINPVTPHTPDAAIYNLVCRGQDDAPSGASDQTAG